jgi:hypothetical protein
VNLTATEGLKDTWRVPADLIAKCDTVIDSAGTHKK